MNCNMHCDQNCDCISCIYFVLYIVKHCVAWHDVDSLKPSREISLWFSSLIGKYEFLFRIIQVLCCFWSIGWLLKHWLWCFHWNCMILIPTKISLAILHLCSTDTSYRRHVCLVVNMWQCPILAWHLDLWLH